LFSKDLQLTGDLEASPRIAFCCNLAVILLAVIGTPKVAALIMVLLFLPVHYMLWGQVSDLVSPYSF
jgi:hypothetical protein